MLDLKKYILKYLILAGYLINSQRNILIGFGNKENVMR